MSIHPPTRNAIGIIIRWAAVVANTFAAFGVPLVAGGAAVGIYEGVGRDPLGETFLRLFVVASVLAGLYLVVGYWRVGLGTVGRSSANRLWALSLGYNVTLSALAVSTEGPVPGPVATWTLCMAGLSGYELIRGLRTGPQNPPLQADEGP